ncbi:hypothetical protein Dsin_009348 [Dipteronia sinensis]|uniref:Reverse transcriptase domain-containing protein n=1 Tax=Dipteronia sinensis TaxID=43782 RepID=A0AAE0EBJ6_9ROSI|nr:hypothetical protein Dsin_009348 [Dipteronia sinensis]
MRLLVVGGGGREKEGGIVLKLDFEKAYDSVDHKFLDLCLEGMCFGDKWRGWICNCTSSPMISILFNGSPTKEFGIGKGFRQGEPLSPFLFNIVVEALNRMLLKARDLNMFRGKVFDREGIYLTHLQFADDTILFIEVKEESLVNVRGILRCQKASLPFINLGFPLGGNPNLIRNRRNGGLGIGQIQDKGNDMLAKWILRIGNEVEALWRQVVCAKYSVESRNLVWDWNEFYALAVKKIEVVCEFGAWNGAVWQWNVETRRHVLGWEEEVWFNFINKVDKFKMRSSSPDSLIWTHTPSGSFLFAHFKGQLRRGWQMYLLL